MSHTLSRLGKIVQPFADVSEPDFGWMVWGIGSRPKLRSLCHFIVCMSVSYPRAPSRQLMPCDTTRSIDCFGLRVGRYPVIRRDTSLVATPSA